MIPEESTEDAPFDLDNFLADTDELFDKIDDGDLELELKEEFKTLKKLKNVPASAKRNWGGESQLTKRQSRYVHEKEMQKIINKQHYLKKRASYITASRPDTKTDRMLNRKKRKVSQETLRPPPEKIHEGVMACRGKPYMTEQEFLVYEQNYVLWDLHMNTQIESARLMDEVYEKWLKTKETKTKQLTDWKAHLELFRPSLKKICSGFPDSCNFYPLDANGRWFFLDQPSLTNFVDSKPGFMQQRVNNVFKSFYIDHVFPTRNKLISDFPDFSSIPSVPQISQRKSVTNDKLKKRPKDGLMNKCLHCGDELVRETESYVCVNCGLVSGNQLFQNTFEETVRLGASTTQPYERIAHVSYTFLVSLGVGQLTPGFTTKSWSPGVVCTV